MNTNELFTTKEKKTNAAQRVEERTTKKNNLRIMMMIYNKIEAKYISLL